MLVVPGSHRFDALDRSAPPRDAVPLCVRARTNVIFDRRLWHARADNTGAATRKALFLAYTYRWIRPRDELSGLDAEAVARLDPVRRQLVGGGSTLGYWFPTDEEAPLRMR